MGIQTSQVLLVVDPTTKPTEAQFKPAPRLADLTDKRVAIVDDSKENAKELLEEIVQVLKDRFGVKEVRYHRKPSASKPAEAHVIEDLAAACDYAVVAIGS